MLIGLGTVKSFDHRLYHGSSPDGLEPSIDLTAEELQYISSIQEPIIKAKPSHCGTYFASISSSTVYLWFQRPTALIAKVTRNPDNVGNYCGGNVDLVWRPDSTAVATVTSAGFIQIYHVNPTAENEKILKYDLLHTMDTEDGLMRSGQGLPGSWLQLQLSVRVPEGITSILGLADDILFVPEIAAGIYAVSWTGEWRPAANELYANLIEPAELGNAGIIGMFYERTMELYAFLLTDGSVFMSFQKSINEEALASTEALDPKSQFSGQLVTLLDESPLRDSQENISRRKSVHFRCFDENKKQQSKGAQATAISFNPRHRLVAIGTERGSIHVYYFNEQYQLLLSHKLKLPKKSPVRSLCWACDGTVLAVAAADNGCSIYSTFGHLIFSTDSQEEDRNISEYFGNVSQLNPFLITDDRLLLYTGADSELSSFNASATTTWQTHQAPAVYMAENWPIKCASASQDGKKIAVAGRRGFAICLVKRYKWKMFGNDQHEKTFTCSGGMAWYKHVLIVAAHDTQLNQNQIRFYNSDKNLLNTNIMHLLPTERRIISMNVIMNHLLVLTADNQAHHLSLHLEADGNQLKIQRVRQISLDGLVPDPFKIQYFDWFIPLVGDHLSTKAAIDQAAFIVLNQGQLSLSIDDDEKTDGNDSDLKWERMFLMDKIEFCWPCSIRNSWGSMHNSLWAFRGSRMFVWTNLLIGTQPGTSWHHDPTPLEIGMDVYPLSVFFTRGIAVGVEQHILQRPVIGPEFRTLVKCQLILHQIIRHLLKRRLMQDAILFANQYESCDYFGHSMEILVHRALEEECETKIGFHESALLPQIVAFLRNFRQFYEVIVRCARKTEVSQWEYLFSIVGDPKQLFQHCLSQGQLRTAASYLIILQTLEPFAITSKLQVELLERALEAEEFPLCSEIVRYLTLANSNYKVISPDGELPEGTAAGSSNATLNSISNSNQRRLIAVSTEEETSFYIDILVSRHARRLMQSHRLRSIGNMARAVQFPLAEWLRKERNRTADISDLPAAFRELHQQFGWQFPEQTRHQLESLMKSPVNGNTSVSQSTAADGVISPTPLSSAPFSASAGKSRWRSGGGSFSLESHLQSAPPGKHTSHNLVSTAVPQTSGPPINRRRAFSFLSATPANDAYNFHRAGAELEIRFLADACHKARCYAWCILLCTMLADIETVIETLQECSQRDAVKFNWLIDQYRKTIMETGSVEYLQFLQSIEEVLSLT